MSLSRKIAFCVVALQAVAASAFAASEFKQGEVIVKYRDGVVRPRQTMNTLYQAAGVRAVRHFKGTMKGFEHIILDESVKVQDAIAEFEKNPMVEYAQPNYIIRISPFEQKPQNGIPCIPGIDIPGCDPNAKLPCLIPGVPFPPGCDDGSGGGGGGGDPGDGGGGGTPSTRPELKPAPPEVNPPVADPDLAKAYGIGKIKADQAWSTHRGTKDMVVAVIDTGIDYNHDDLSFNVWRNPNPTKGDVVGFDFIHNDGIPYDDQGHGTHCAGTIGAVGGNGIGVSGVNQRVSIMGVKFLSAEGSGTTEGAIKSIDYAVENGARVLSNSWGGRSDGDNKALYDAIERAKVKGALFVAAAGNEGKDNDNASEASYPAAFDNDNLLAVAATDERDGMAFFSNYGRKTTHVGAPGVNVYSLAPGSRYASMSGTSMACPHVAGAAALIWSANPSWDYKKVKETLMNTVDKLPSLAGKTVTGGRINVLNALQAN
ncbi:MAG: S8 family serine peptidase [Bdellovibrionales bacterium]|nr:S8 family serine peptidase [Bdellovibrionales bacterium]